MGYRHSVLLTSSKEKQCSVGVFPYFRFSSNNNPYPIEQVIDPLIASGMTRKNLNLGVFSKRCSGRKPYRGRAFRASALLFGGY
jgi:hypothetical protein